MTWLRHCVNSAALSAMRANTQANTEGATGRPQRCTAGSPSSPWQYTVSWPSVPMAAPDTSGRPAAQQASLHMAGSMKLSGGVSELWVIWPCRQLCRAAQTMRHCAAPCCCCCCHTPDEVAGGGIVRGIHNHVVLPHQLDCTGMPTKGISAEPRHKAQKEVQQASAPL